MRPTSEPNEEELALAEELSRRDDIEETDQSVGTLRETFEEEELDKLPDDEILETSGLLSHVREEGETIGHILMIEWDDVDDIMRVIRTASALPGISVLHRSSPGSYHLYGLSVRPVEDQLLDAMRKNGDVYQARWGARRGYFALRILPKIRSESREIYKTAPQPVRVFNSESDYPQSRPHLDMLIQIAEEHGTELVEEDLRAAREEHELVGDSLRIDHYQTVTDESKEVL